MGGFDETRVARILRAAARTNDYLDLKSRNYPLDIGTLFGISLSIDLDVWGSEG